MLVKTKPQNLKHGLSENISAEIKTNNQLNYQLKIKITYENQFKTNDYQ